MALAGNPSTPAADQKIQIGALIGLQYMIDVQPLIASGPRDRRRLPGGLSTIQLVVRNTQL